ISIKEYDFYRLIGKFVVDYSVASATGLFNLENLYWDSEAFELAGITIEQLAKPVSTTKGFTGVKQEYSEYMGISEQTPFVIGASVGVLSNLGVDAIEPGVVAVTIGTSGAIRTLSEKPQTDPKGR